MPIFGRQRANFCLIQFFFGVNSWNLWKSRNKIVMEKRFDRSTDEILLKIFFDLQNWRRLLRSQEQEELDCLLQKLVKWHSEFRELRRNVGRMDFL